MAYNTTLYNPYGMQMQPQPMMQMQPQQPVNGFEFIDDPNILYTLRMPPGSMSQPYFLKGRNVFGVVTCNKDGSSVVEFCKFEKIPASEVIGNNSSEFVTREYFDQQMNNILEAINGKHVLQQEPTESAE